MATKNSINNISNPLSASAVTVDPGSSGDSYIDLNINTVQKYRIGIDDTDGDSFKLSPAALGTGDLWKITSGGNVTHPLSSAVHTAGTTQNNITGDATDYTVTFVTETYDKNNNFASPTFTAPVTGIYFFCGYLIPQGTNSSSLIIQLVSTARTYTSNYSDPTTLTDGVGNLGVTFSFLADMTASDTATIHITASGGTKVTDVSGPLFISLLS